MKNRILRIFALSVLGIFLGTGIAWYQVQQEMSSGARALSAIEPAAGQSESDVGGPFTLQNHKGEAVTEQDFAGQYKLIFFGFANCPMICPTELQKMTAAMQILGEQSDNITPIFISVDPERDTPEMLDEYVQQFHPRLVALTGTKEQLENVKDNYKVYSEKVTNEAMSGYMVNHSSFTYFMGPDDTLIDIFSMEETPTDIANGVRDIIQGS